MGAHFQAQGMLTAALAMPPTLALFAAIGAVSAAFIVLSKRGDPFTPVVTQTTNFLAGALFPIAVLPGVLQGVAHILPPFYALQVLREGLINGHSITSVGGDYAILLAFAVVLLPLSLVALKKALRVGARHRNAGVVLVRTSEALAEAEGAMSSRADYRRMRRDVAECSWGDR